VRGTILGSHEFGGMMLDAAPDAETGDTILRRVTPVCVWEMPSYTFLIPRHLSATFPRVLPRWQGRYGWTYIDLFGHWGAVATLEGPAGASCSILDDSSRFVVSLHPAICDTGLDLASALNITWRCYDAEYQHILTDVPAQLSCTLDLSTHPAQMHNIHISIGNILFQYVYAYSGGIRFRSAKRFEWSNRWAALPSLVADDAGMFDLRRLFPLTVQTTFGRRDLPATTYYTVWDAPIALDAAPGPARIFINDPRRVLSHRLRYFEVRPDFDLSWCRNVPQNGRMVIMGIL
jgi:hypothetical protein